MREKSHQPIVPSLLTGTNAVMFPEIQRVVRRMASAKPKNGWTPLAATLETLLSDTRQPIPAAAVAAASSPPATLVRLDFSNEVFRWTLVLGDDGWDSTVTKIGRGRPGVDPQRGRFFYRMVKQELGVVRTKLRGVMADRKSPTPVRQKARFVWALGETWLMKRVCVVRNVASQPYLAMRCPSGPPRLSDYRLTDILSGDFTLSDLAKDIAAAHVGMTPDAFRYALSHRTRRSKKTLLAP